MAGTEFEQILQTFDVYLKLLENAATVENLTCENISKAFNCSMFVEATILQANNEKQTQNFENHLHSHWREMNRTRLYTCSELLLACDKLLEVILKSSKVSTEIVDKFLHLYVQYCGPTRLKSFLDKMFSDTLCGNILMNSMVELGLPMSTIEYEARVITWEHAASCGQIEEVYQAINQMISDGNVEKVLGYLPQLDENSTVEKLIIKNLIQQTNAYNVTSCLAILKVKRKILFRLLQDLDFQVSFMDAIFYFGRNMNRDENGTWKSDNLFTYRHLVSIISDLLSIPNKVSTLTKQRLKLAKAHIDGVIWGDVEKECSESITE